MSLPVRGPLRLIALGVLALALLIPASAPAKGGLANKLAAKACVQEKKSIGRKAFAKRYGERNAMRACMRKKRSDARQAIAAATAECQAELDDFGAEDFYEDWVSFEECVAYYAEADMVVDPSEDDDAAEDDEDF
jgi:hypothetical protein